MSDTFAEITPSVAADNSQEALREEVLRRMEIYVLELLYNALPPPCAAAGETGVVDGFTATTQPSAQTTPKIENPNGQKTTIQRSSSNPLLLPLMSSKPLRLRTLHTTRRHLLLLRLLYFNVKQRTVQTHRDVYYHLVRELPSQSTVNHTVQQLARVLRVPRQLMGVMAGGRGYIAGAICYRGTSLEGAALAREGMPLPLVEAEWRVSCVEQEEYAVEREEEELDAEHVACATLSTPLRGFRAESAAARAPTLADEGPPLASPSSYTAGFQIKSNVRFILVVEKHAVFVHLLRSGLPRLVPCVLLTAQGFPTHAAHRLLANLHAAVPQAVVIGLVDYNPYGLAILSAYRWPSTGVKGPASFADTEESPSEALIRGAMPENRFCAVASLRWFAVRAVHLRRVESSTEPPQQTRDSTGSRTRRRGTQSRNEAPTEAALEPAETHPDAMSLKKQGDSSLAADRLRTRRDVRLATGCLSGLASQHRQSGKNSREGGTLPQSVRIASSLSTVAAGVTASSIIRGVRTRPPLPPPLQPFTPRDTAVLSSIIAQLEARLRSASSTANVLGPPTEVAAENTHAVKRIKRSHRQSQRNEAEGSDTPADSPFAIFPPDDAEVASISAWLREAKEMRARAAKCELEVLYTHPFASLFGGASVATSTASTFSSPATQHREGAATRPAAATSGFAVWVAQQLLRGQYI
ncbi:meiotic recombination protein Spo11 [Leptomonas pyrrhocoris]|uniref:DNA topoisomerase (ATP-hydrolyzing) n=1 Tax=Leptomonas pyrrhocoris TaxID=157538 RepID=A0A0N0VEG1_LEPPY|nr:meiotic recombination protein Spo11 [Leptomonas pyrrhocoris]KPA77858.1 meiotic recombination protein Spo11 [Leptomonas pyrrhocoris]|eukprot:XP_015656297.1 meiotic recombination protein Spo11 [Leptomonas pyrrhocoris]